MARQWQTQTLEQDPKDPMHRSELARVCNSMSNYLFLSGDTNGALKCAADVISTLQGMVGTDDADARDEDEWYLAHKLLIDVAVATKSSRAKDLVRDVLPVMERRAKLNPQNELYARQLVEIQAAHLQAQRAPANVIAETTKLIAVLTPLYRNAKNPVGQFSRRMLP